jgi:hypothetical protein
MPERALPELLAAGDASMGALTSVAGATERLQVARVVGAAGDDRNDVVDMLGGSAAAATLVAVALENLLPRDAPRARAPVAWPAARAVRPAVDEGAAAP